LKARPGETVASCLLRNGVTRFRTTPVSGAARMPFCMIGHCFECLVEIEGLGSRQSCLTAVLEGMQIATQAGAATVSARAR
jgi:predicted molibdopterin-dependent oxidoreductase YjgC